MFIPPINPYQREVIERPIAAKIFLEGPAGMGKTTVGILPEY
jgi:replication-associated recombination protein RarA